MSSKKTRREKIQKQEIVRILKELNKEVLELEHKIEDQKTTNIKNLHIKNLKIFGSVCNYITPYILSATISIGVVSYLGGGFPVVLDDMPKYKLYSLVYKTDGVINGQEYYKSDYLFNSKLPDNELKIYSPWELTEDNNYSRIIQIYDIDRLETFKLHEAVLNEDVEYIKKYFTDFKQEIEITNMQPKYNEGYVIDASLHFLDKSDILKEKESYLKNILITLGELIFALSCGVATNGFRQLFIGDKINQIKEKYKTISIEPLEKELKQKKDKILSITRGKKNVN